MLRTMSRGVVAIGVALLTGVGGGVASAVPPTSAYDDVVSGQEAIDRIEAGAPLDLGSPPAGSELSRDEVVEMFRDDPALHLSGDQLVYIDTVDSVAAEAPGAAPPTYSAATGSAATGSPFDDAPRLRDIVVSPADVKNAFNLHSRPESPHKIYLDFNGHTSDEYVREFRNITEFAPFDLDGDPDSFNTTEREWIVRWWSRVIADFDTWDVDITTEEPAPDYLAKTDPDDNTYGVRVMVTSTEGRFGARGIGRRGSFNAAADIPAYTLVDRETFGDPGFDFIWEEYTPWVISHEVGHTLYLGHDIAVDPENNFTAYYPGHNGWAPIMGGGMIDSILRWTEPRTIVQWSKGEYLWARELQDDRAIIEGVLGALLDDHSSSPTPVESGVVTPGLINSDTDSDEFSFVTDGGTVEVKATLPLPGKELDLSLEVRNAAGSVVASQNTPGVVAETLTFDAAPGRYVITVDGVGTGDPITGYSDYSSTGAYELVVTGRGASTSSDLIDFNGDGIGDIFTVVPRGDGRYQWQFSSGGSAELTDLAVGDEPLDSLRFGDFDGDGKTDVFTASPINGKFQWKFSSAGTGPWQNLRLSAESHRVLRFGDFDGDGTTDVFTVSRQGPTNRWKYSSGGTGAWTNLATSPGPLTQLRFGDFDGDGKTDVFTAKPTKNGGYQWMYSSGGKSAWQNLLKSVKPYARLKFADFDGDGTTDVFTVSVERGKYRWKYSSGGTKSWKKLAVSGQPFDRLQVGDFDGDGAADVFSLTSQGLTNRLLYSSAGTSRWQQLITTTAPLNQLRFGYVSSNS